MPNPRIMEGYQAGVDDDPESYLEEQQVRPRTKLATIPDDNNNNEREDEGSSQFDNEPAYFEEPSSFAADLPSSLPREIVVTPDTTVRKSTRSHKAQAYQVMLVILLVLLSILVCLAAMLIVYVFVRERNDMP